MLYIATKAKISASGELTYLFPAVRAMVSGKCAGWTVTMLDPHDQGEHLVFEGLENYQAGGIAVVLKSLAQTHQRGTHHGFFMNQRNTDEIGTWIKALIVNSGQIATRHGHYSIFLP